MNNQICNKIQVDFYPNRLSEFVNQIMRQYQKLFERQPEYFRYIATDVDLEFLSENVVRSLASRVQKYRSVTMNLSEQIRLKMNKLVPYPENSVTNRDLWKPNQRFVLQPVRLPVGAIAVQHFIPAPPRLLPARIPNPTPQRVRHLPVPARNGVPLFPVPRQMQPVGRPPAAVRVPPPQQQRQLGPARELQQDTIRHSFPLRPVAMLTLHKDNYEHVLSGSSTVSRGSTASRGSKQLLSYNRSGLNGQFPAVVSNAYQMLERPSTSYTRFDHMDPSLYAGCMMEPMNDIPSAFVIPKSTGNLIGNACHRSNASNTLNVARTSYAANTRMQSNKVNIINVVSTIKVEETIKKFKAINNTVNIEDDNSSTSSSN